MSTPPTEGASPRARRVRVVVTLDPTLVGRAEGVAAVSGAKLARMIDRGLAAILPDLERALPANQARALAELREGAS